MPSAKPRSADHLRLVTPATATAGMAAKPQAVAAAPMTAIARPLGDWLWHGLGIGAATASAGFATYALIFSTGEVVPSGNFNVFARYDRLYQAAGAQHAGPKSPAPAPTETADNGGVDFAPTGSVGAAAAPGGATGSAGAARPRRAPDGPALPNFTLRDVFDGKALVESRSSLSVVKPGSMLDGAGEVLSIEKRGERWVVLTQNGVIAGQKR
ncbi:hypothetical protein [Lichenibacterium minor]|uniref:hypothetical protein n=1 Tax=Lichenibacterium minor TaxID=2316528 RepID=UPI001FE1AFD2|nr:hypothetical protein [Lichenibacterium minor]